jgi:hypothetical protein
MHTSILRTIMAPLRFEREPSEATDVHSFQELMRKLEEGWDIKPPVYVMGDPGHRDQIVFRLAIWRDGRPKVATVPDGDDIRRFIAEHHLAQENL